MGEGAQVEGGLVIEQRGALQLLTLERPGVLNALAIAMRADLAAALPRFARDPQTYAIAIRSAVPKAFSVGGDVRELSELWRRDPAAVRRALGEEYALCWRQECFSKPTLSFIDGLVMGSGVGISLYGTHRIAGEGYAFAMPETALGLFPDVGTAHAFARMPGETGTFLALTGRRIARADAYRLGLVTHSIARAHFDDILKGVADADCVDPLLDDRHEPPGPGELEPHCGVIERCFSAETVEEIIARLEGVAGAGQPFAAVAAGELRQRSPTSLKLTLRLVRMARALDLAATLELDQRLACRCFEGHDVHEGIRAMVIDKDRLPRWQPARLEDVTEAAIDAYFVPLANDELRLPTRADMQLRRT